MDYRKKLRQCRTCAEAQPILEALRVRPSQRKLIETAIQLRQSKDPRQASYGEDFFLTAIREVEDDKTQENNGGAHNEQGGEADIAKIVKENTDDENGTKEADSITGSLDSHQSSDLDMPYPKEGTDAPNSDIESSKTAQGVNQMGGIQENMNGMGMPQMGGMPPMAPEVQQAMQPKMPPMPQMNTPQMMRQMQYTVEANLRKYLTPVIRETKKLREAYIALDKKIQEAQSQAGSMKLDLDSIRAKAPARERVRETIGDTEIPMPRMEFPRARTEEARQHIAQMDKELSKNRDTPYQ